MPGTESNPTDDSGREQSGNDQEQEKMTEIKEKRKSLRGKMTRAMNRLRDSSRHMEVVGERRLNREMQEIQKDFNVLCELHGKLYDLTEADSHAALDKWEADLATDFYEFEEEIEDRKTAYKALKGDRRLSVQTGQTPMLTRSNSGRDTTSRPPNERSEHSAPQRDTHINERETVPDTMSQERHREPDMSTDDCVEPRSTQGSHIPFQETVHMSDQCNMFGGHFALGQGHLPRRMFVFDSWIDDLVEFQETTPPRRVRDMSVADALYRLEATKDVPNVRLCQFDGNPLQYVEFIESFKLHIHDKYHLTNDIRMLQLKMHVTSDADRAIAGLGSAGVMYATALKLLKEQFGDKSVIARAHINKLTKGSKIMPSNRQGLRDFSLDMINCLATMKRIGFHSDVNASDSLRRIVKRLPDHLIIRWKVKAAELRDNGAIPTLDHISTLLRQQVKISYDPDFGDLEIGGRAEQRVWQKEKGRGVNAVIGQPKSEDRKRLLKCYVCSDQHRVSECPTFSDSTVSERFKIAKEQRLCYGCLNRGHTMRDCRSKKKCEKAGCDKQHHRLLHTDPPPSSTVTTAFDKDGLLPVVRVLFRSNNGQVRQGNVLIDSGAATTIIRKEFSKALGLQGKREALELSVVGGQRLDQNDSRRVKVWICPLQGNGEYEIEAHEIDNTIVSVQPLDRHWLSSFQHLSDVQYSHKAGPIDLILGVQYSHLHVEEEIRKGTYFEPVGKKTKLGWFVIGPSNSRTPDVSINFVQKVNMETLYDMETRDSYTKLFLSGKGDVA